MRNRTRNSRSYGSMWMSLAPLWMADISTRLTSRMTGASPLCRSSAATSSSSSSLEHLDVAVGDRRAASPRARASPASSIEAPEGGCRGRRRAVPRDRRRRLAGRAVVLRDRLATTADLRRHHRFDVVARHELDVVHGEHVRRVGHRDGERRARPVDGEDLVLLGRVGRNELDDVRIDLELREVDGRDAVLLAEQRGDRLRRSRSPA